MTQEERSVVSGCTYDNCANGDDSKVKRSECDFLGRREPQSLVHEKPEHTAETVGEPTSEQGGLI
jgi:hypothetical protein